MGQHEPLRIVSSESAAPPVPVGLHVLVRTDAPGLNELAPRVDHRLSIHAGVPVRGACPESGRRYTRRRGDIMVLPAGRSIAFEDAEASTSLSVQLSPALLRGVAHDLGIDPGRAGLELRHLVRDPQIAHVAWALDAERRAGYPAGRLYIDSLGIALAVHLLGRYATPLATRAGLSPRQLRHVVEFIETHLDQDLSLARLAGVAYVSASHFKTLFRRSMGVPVHSYVIRRRVERARRLLLAGELPAGEVALAAGFSDQSHMARSMRRVLGITPSIVRRTR